MITQKYRFNNLEDNKREITIEYRLPNKVVVGAILRQ